MSIFRKLSYVVWHCQYHIVWVPKHRYRVLKDRIGFEVSKTIRIFSERLGCEVVERNVQSDRFAGTGATEGIHIAGSG